MSTKTKAPIGQRTVIGFDFGKKYIGVAVGQEMTGSATPLGSIKATDGMPHWHNLAKYLTEWQPDVIVVGLPLNMDGSEQQLTLDAKKFGKRIQGRFGINVEFQDERLTTADAKEQLFARGGFKNLKKDNIDAESARLIIESYFAQQYGD
ncbi:Holliday junction resolvase [Colwellia sp. MT41]|uniref:Putative pre-16S rRNA nuclease n=1 Tax=Colwellia marinimaniae TaxID=1513592 RepID=A0ABQ0MQV8_9GAMM|nr:MULTISPECIES: Holliday junction resolvase RuvX [Colwellia]ALO34157.1 Holliday junction resolvase [Colwellia sp. MT41]GAW94740.1 putative pre-16S rRNA nuclease [Colwellia marinimaniae]